MSTEDVHDTGLRRSLRLAQGKSPGGASPLELRNALAQAYRILLTWGIYGVYLWFEDEETRTHIEDCLARKP